MSQASVVTLSTSRAERGTASAASDAAVAHDGLLSVRAGLEAERRDLLERLGGLNRDIEHVDAAVEALRKVA